MPSKMSASFVQNSELQMSTYLGTLNRKPPPRHLTKATNTRTNTQGAFSTELDRDETEGFIS